jgi:hypothetical protein
MKQPLLSKEYARIVNRRKASETVAFLARMAVSMQIMHTQNLHKAQNLREEI